MKIRSLEKKSVKNSEEKILKWHKQNNRNFKKIILKVFSSLMNPDQIYTHCRLCSIKFGSPLPWGNLRFSNILLVNNSALNIWWFDSLTFLKSTYCIHWGHLINSLMLVISGVLWPNAKIISFTNKYFYLWQNLEALIFIKGKYRSNFFSPCLLVISFTVLCK